jgi:aryl-alcohol dehydrogenase-like predicted oxidoreductase
MINRSAEGELFGYCREHDMGIVCYSPMHRGLLSGKFSVERFKNLPSDDHRRNVPAFKEPALSTNLALVERLRHIAERNGKTVGQLAIAWTLFHDAVTAAIVGARNPRQIEETAQAGDWELSQEDIDEIETFLTVS